MKIHIIGAGPVGLFAAYYVGLRGAEPIVYDFANEVGGQLNLYKEKKVFDVAGFTEITGEQLKKELHKQAEQYSPRYEMSQLRGGDILEKVKNKEPVIITVGGGIMIPNRLGVEGEDKAIDEGYLKYEGSMQEVRSDQTVLIVGGGDSAVDWALEFAKMSCYVVLLHRRNDFRAHASNMQILRKMSNVEILTPYKVGKIYPSANGRVSVGIESTDGTGKRDWLSFNKIVCCLGFKTDYSALKGLGIRLIPGGIEVNQKMETGVPGVYAAGDVAMYDGKVKLLCVGFGEASTAVCNAIHWADEKIPVFGGFSTSLVKKEKNG